jgi:hypothetical protein
LTLSLATGFALGACDDGGSDGGVSEAEARQACIDSCNKGVECSMVQFDCDMLCSEEADSDTDGEAMCSDAEQREITDHLKMCAAMECDGYTMCIQEIPTCG